MENPIDLEQSLDPIREYVNQFQLGQAYRTVADKYVHFLLEQNDYLRDLINERDRSIIELMSKRDRMVIEMQQLKTDIKIAQEAKNAPGIANKSSK